MRTETFSDANAFLTQAESLLMGDEARNNLALGLVLSLLQIPHRSAVFTLVRDETDTVIAAGVWSPIHKKIVISTAPDSNQGPAATQLAQAIAQAQPITLTTLLSVYAPPEAGPSFLDAWQAAGGSAGEVHSQQLILKLEWGQQTTVPAFQIPSGRLRCAWLEDLAKLRQWSTSMVIESGLKESPQETSESTRRAIENRQLFIWDDQRAVAMAALSARTPTGVRMSSVYVPMEFRRKGYGRACVWGLAERARQTGYKFVCLFADNHNTATLNLYQQLGFQTVGTITEYTMRENLLQSVEIENSDTTG